METMRNFWCLTSITSIMRKVMFKYYFRFPSASSSFVLDTFSGFPWINLGKVSDLRWTFSEIHASVFLVVLDSGIFCMCTVCIQCMLIKKFTLCAPYYMMASAVYIVITTCLGFCLLHRIDFMMEKRFCLFRLAGSSKPIKFSHKSLNQATFASYISWLVCWIIKTELYANCELLCLALHGLFLVNQKYVTITVS